MTTSILRTTVSIVKYAVLLVLRPLLVVIATGAIVSLYRSGLAAFQSIFYELLLAA
ncbi:uncharacterized protein BO95DRAFT_129270 [Aspergillus brunneoviolaceus CBS 621.78]|uniref:Uncharacterized protein n=1 Tax=Aspergillus brunneoviolaceus CBS 621.78 TaxID=1450534 RepID=A0ACD1G972_9EURO|nr:hypothetical protein BO95DRAFT_129270 [Aspergillus brunneoviolaceus CBS 621.78]RAH45801.1 hypothetical protein BO95DRAFT_129270 [Aspergillus brunneoviolaceus CBS 621.78]